MQAFLDWLAQWYNLVFLAPLAFGMVFALVEILTGGLGDLLGLDFDLDLDGDADIDLDLDIDVDADVDFDGHFSWMAGLNWIGVGLVPLTIVLEVFLISFGFLGLMANSLVAEIWAWAPNITFFVTAPTALFASMWVTHVFAGFLAKHFLANANTGTTLGVHVGEVGEVTSGVSDRSGEVRIQPAGGEPKFVSARASNPAFLDRGSKVVLVQFDQARGLYFVEAVPNT